MRISLRFKFILIIAIVEAIFLTLLLLFSLNVVKEQEKTLFQNKKEIVNRFITDIFATPILVNDVATIDDTIKNIVSKDDIVSIEIFDERGTTLSKLCVENCPKDLMNKDYTPGEYSFNSSFYFLQKEDIVVAETKIGSISIVFNTTKSKENIDEFFNTMFFIATLEIFFVIIVGWYANKLLINSLLKMRTATENFAKTGEFQKLAITSKDELEDLANNFEEMQKTIIEHRHTLEDRIKEEVDKNREKDLVILKQARTSAMGDLISTLAHQWRQPLNILSLLFEDVRDAYEAKELDQKYLNASGKEFEKTIQGLSSVIDNFRDFFKPESEKEKFSISQKIQEIQELLQLELTSNRVSFQVEENPSFKRASLLGFQNEFKQAFLNIIKNSIEALQEKSSHNSSFRGEIKVIGKVEDREITIEVQDNGCGIDEKIKHRVFEPYFTTKERDIGKGIGLYMSKMTIEKMGGEITINEKHSSGASFLLHFKS